MSSSTLDKEHLNKIYSMEVETKNQKDSQNIKEIIYFPPYDVKEARERFKKSYIKHFFDGLIIGYLSIII
jgi:hypothetical protein